MRPLRTDRRRVPIAPLVACAVCALAGAVLCLIAGVPQGVASGLDPGALARRPAPAATLLFGLGGVLVALHGRPVPKNRLRTSGRERHRGEVAAGRRPRVGHTRHGEGATHARGNG